MNEPFLDFMKTELPERAVLIACGLPASYKTETTEVISAIKGWIVLRTDIIRLEVLKNEDIFDEKVASNMNKRTMVYDEMFRLAGELAASGKGIILDATFVTQELRLRAASVAAGNGCPFIIQQTSCPKEVSLRRIAGRSKENYESNALTEQAYTNNVKKFEPVDLEGIKSRFKELDIIHLTIDTSSDHEEDWRVVERVER